MFARRRKAHEMPAMDDEVRHLLHVPELGFTMADGGEPHALAAVRYARA